MNRTTLRTTIGLSVVTSHFLLLIMVAVFRFFDKFSTNEMFVTMGILSPLFATYTTAIVASFSTQNPHHNVVGKAPGVQVAISFLVLLFFILTLLGSILWKTLGSLAFDDFVKLIAVIETSFGVYAGMVISSLFKNEQKSE